MKLITISLIFLLLAACTKLEWGYRLAPRSMMSKLDDSFNFNSDRFKQIKNQLDDDFKTNRIQVAQLVMKHVDEIFVFAEKKEVAASDFKTLMNSMQTTRGQLVRLFKPTFDVVITNLNGDEITSLDKFSKKKFKELDKKLSEKEDYIEKQIDTFEKVMDFLFDSSSKEQVLIYKQFVEENYEYYLEQAEQRKIFVKKFESLISSKDQLVDFVLNYYAGDSSTRTEKHQKKTVEISEKFNSLLERIWVTLTPKQKANLKENLLNLKNELTSLMKNS